MKIRNKVYNISDKLNKKIVLISDIHYYNKKDIIKLNKVLDNIKNIKPDYICISGDTLDNANVKNFDLLKEWLNKLSNICIVIMVLGNHEFYKDKKNKIFEFNKNYINKIKKINNLYLLDNDNLIIDDINFIGITLPIKHYMNNMECEEEFKTYIKNIKTKDKYYNILLCHSPVNISKEQIIKNIDVDLVLCGHMHGGIIPNFLRGIFKTKGLISPYRKLFPKNVYGNIKIGKKHIIITSGITVLSRGHFIFFNNVFSSEIVEINI